MMTDQATTTPIPTPDLNKLVYDVALRYDTPEELALRYDLPAATLQIIMEHPAFRKAVLIAERDVLEAGTHFRLKARKLSTMLLDELSALALDASVEPSDRLRAIQELTKLAGYAAEAAATTNVQVNIDLRAALDAADERARRALTIDGEKT